MTLPSAPPTQPGDPEEVELLLQFVRERDVRCPRCDYNLRNLTQPVCPECREQLHLSVGLTRPKFGWLIAALAPGIFSGIAAIFVTGVLIVVNISPTGKAPWQPYALDAFGWTSALTAGALFLQRYRFLKQRNEIQITIAGVVWVAHVMFFVLMWTLLR
jgi:hypothetical protein